MTTGAATCPSTRAASTSTASTSTSTATRPWPLKRSRPVNLTIAAKTRPRTGQRPTRAKSVATGRLVKDPLPHRLATGMQAFWFNTRRAKFADSRVRQALGYAFDFEWTNKNLFYSLYTRSNSYFANSELASAGLPLGRELEILEEYRGRIPDKLFTTEFQLPTNDDSGQLRQNLRRAKRLLQAAGWVVVGDVLTHAETGEVMEIEFLLASSTWERIVAPILPNLKRLGVKATIRTVDQTQYQNRLQTFDYDIISLVRGQSHSPGNEQRSFWTSTAADEPGSLNVAGVKDPVVDELVDRLIQASLAAPNWWRRLGHWIGSCCGGTTPSHTGTAITSAWSTGTNSANPPSPPPTPATTSSCLTLGGTTLTRRRGWNRAVSPTFMGTYILRRLLLMVPTLFGIMTINFPHHPSGTGRPGRAHHRGDFRALARTPPSGSAARAWARPSTRTQRRAARSAANIAVPKGWIPELIAELERMYGFRQAGTRALLADDRPVRALRLWRELLPRPAGRRSGQREDAGVDFAGAVDHAAGLFHFHSPGNRQGRARWLAVRCLGPRGWSSSATPSPASSLPSC